MKNIFIFQKKAKDLLTKMFADILGNLPGLLMGQPMCSKETACLKKTYAKRNKENASLSALLL